MSYTINQLDDGFFEGCFESKQFDFVIEPSDDDAYLVSFFRLDIENPEEAFVETLSANTLEDAYLLIEEWKLP